MFIVAESGSTKTDWVVTDNNLVETCFRTEGINPSVHKVFPALSEVPGLCELLRASQYLYFYGAGVSEASGKERLRDYFTSYGFSGQLYAEGDMLGAARACCGHEPGIVCILGTGSNSCVYDGTRIAYALPSLGFILGDEGGGVHLGKEILRSYYYKQMPADISEKFVSKYNPRIEELIKRIYLEPAPNRYIASFSDFLSEIEGGWKTETLTRVFRDFVTTRILCYPEHRDYKIHFVGSVAHYFKNELTEVLSHAGLFPGKIILKPIDQLIRYHHNNKTNE